VDLKDFKKCFNKIIKKRFDKGRLYFYCDDGNSKSAAVLISFLI